MKRKLIIFASIFSAALLLNSCFLFGGGKSKCGDCPTWSQNNVEQENEIIESENA